MSNTLGNFFRVTSFGESHGQCIGAIIDGCPAGLLVSTEQIQKEMNRRRPGQGTVTTSRIEMDRIEILSGFDNQKIGSN